MGSVVTKQVRRAHLLGGAILVCAALMTSARAAVFRIDLQGTFTNSSNPVAFKTPLLIATSFYIDTNAKACAPSCTENFVAGTVTGYNIATISGMPSIPVYGQTFTQADIPADQLGITGKPNDAVLFDPPLTISNSPESIFFAQTNQSGYTLVWGSFNTFAGPGGNGEFPSLDSTNPLALLSPFDPNIGERSEVAAGTVNVHVTGFAGTPGAPQCHDQSTSALSHKYGSMPQAAVALGYSSVKALQSDIKLFCGS
jgi:hypothetical protein